MNIWIQPRIYRRRGVTVLSVILTVLTALLIILILSYPPVKPFVIRNVPVRVAVHPSPEPGPSPVAP
jgi:hypothetical protein